MLGKGLESLIPPHHSSNGTKPSQGYGGQAGQKDSQGSGVPSTPADGFAPAPAASPVATPALPVQQEAVALAPAQEKALPKEPPHRLSDAVYHIEVDKITPNPNQPRKDFNEEQLRDLADSIREFGILQPLVVTKIEREVPTGTEVEYQLIAGERRLMAAKLAGLPRVPVIVRKVADNRERLELAVIENIQRQNLNPIETARAFARLQDEFRLTQREIATQLGKSREVVANTLRLLDLPTHIQEALAKGDISESHGRLLLTVEERALQEKLFRDLLERRFTTRELRERVDAATKPARHPSPDPAASSQALPSELHMFQEKLSSELGAPVKIEAHGESGKITITFYSKEELEGILEKFKREE